MIGYLFFSLFSSVSIRNFLRFGDSIVPGFVLHVLQLAGVIFGIVGALLAFFGLKWKSVGICMITIVAMIGGYLYLVRKHRSSTLQFSSVFLELFVQLISSGTIYVVICACYAIEVLFLWYWSYLALAAFSYSITYFVYLLFVAYWTTQIVKFSAHYFVADRVLLWYFANLSDETPFQIEWKKFGSLFGSICKGALLIPISESLWSISRRLNCTRCLGSLYSYCNRHGFSYIIMYEGSFSDACKSNWNLFTERGIHLVLYDDILHSLLTMPSIAFSMFYALSVGANVGSDKLIMAIIAGIVCFALFNFSVEIVLSGLCAIYCGFVDNSSYLFEKNSVMFHRLERIAALGNYQERLRYETDEDSFSIGSDELNRV